MVMWAWMVIMAMVYGVDNISGQECMKAEIWKDTNVFLMVDGKNSLELGESEAGSGSLCRRGIWGEEEKCVRLVGDLAATAAINKSTSSARDAFALRKENKALALNTLLYVYSSDGLGNMSSRLVPGLRQCPPKEGKSGIRKNRFECRSSGDPMLWYRGSASTILPARTLSKGDMEFDIDCKTTKCAPCHVENVECWASGLQGHPVRSVDCERWDVIPTWLRDTFGASAENWARIYGSSALTPQHNYCRNPDNSTSGPWCFGKDFRLILKKLEKSQERTALTGVIRAPCFPVCANPSLTAPVLGSKGWPWELDDTRPGEALGPVLSQEATLRGFRPIQLHRFFFRSRDGLAHPPEPHACFQNGERAKVLGPWAYQQGNRWSQGGQGDVYYTNCNANDAQCLWAPCFHRALDNNLKCYPRSLTLSHRRGNIFPPSLDREVWDENTHKIAKEKTLLGYWGPRNTSVSDQPCLYWSDIKEDYIRTRGASILQKLMFDVGNDNRPNWWARIGPLQLHYNGCLDPGRALHPKSEIWELGGGGDVGIKSEVEAGPWCWVEKRGGPRPEPCFPACEDDLLETMACLPSLATLQELSTTPKTYKYEGRQSVDATGSTCRPWRDYQSQLPKDSTGKRVPFNDATMVENFCRNAERGSSEISGPWCITAAGPSPCFSPCDEKEQLVLDPQTRLYNYQLPGELRELGPGFPYDSSMTRSQAFTAFYRQMKTRWSWLSDSLRHPCDSKEEYANDCVPHFPPKFYRLQRHRLVKELMNKAAAKASSSSLRLLSQLARERDPFHPAEPLPPTMPVKGHLLAATVPEPTEPSSGRKERRRLREVPVPELEEWPLSGPGTWIPPDEPDSTDEVWVIVGACLMLTIMLGAHAAAAFSALWTWRQERKAHAWAWKYQCSGVRQGLRLLRRRRHRRHLHEQEETETVESGDIATPSSDPLPPEEQPLNIPPQPSADRPSKDGPSHPQPSPPTAKQPRNKAMKSPDAPAPPPPTPVLPPTAPSKTKVESEKTVDEDRSSLPSSPDQSSPHTQ